MEDKGPAPEAKEKWYHKVWFVIAMLLTIGPLAFPLLWKSPRFNRPTKWFLTILFILLTILTIWLSAETFKLVLQEIKEIQTVIG